mgnify:CR=1 FL=1
MCSSDLLGNARMVAYSAGGPSLDPGNMDLSARLPAMVSLVAADIPPLTLTSSARPLVGSTFQLTSNNILPGTILGATLLSFLQISPSLDLGALGAPGCMQSVAPDFTQIFLAAGASGSTPLTIPNFASYSGLQLFAQSAAFTAGYNSLGIVTSNGLNLTIGNL